MLITSIFLALFAGMMNGSYAFPLKYMRLPENLTWVIFSALTFLIAPWVGDYFISSNLLHYMAALPIHDITILTIGGLLFGCGMVLFTFSLKYVGMGVAFLLNIAGGTIVGSILPVLLLDASKLLKPVGLIQLLALALFLLGVVFTGFASAQRDKHLNKTNTLKGKNIYGITLGIFSGLLCSAQGFVYSFVLPDVLQLSILQNHAIIAAAIPWIPIFNAAFAPYFLFFLWLAIRKKELHQLKKIDVKAIGFLVLMTVFYYGSLMVFSKSSTMLGDMGSVIAWPILMISIILTSNIWGFIQGEWRGAGKHAVHTEIVSLLLLCVAVAILAYDGYLNLLG